MKATSAHPAPTPRGYAALTADEKAEWLWRELVTSREDDPVLRPGLAAAKPLTMLRVVARPSVLEDTFERSDDLMDPDRPKIIHAQGAIARVAYEAAASSPYTGVLGPPPTGGAIGIVRLSLAIPPKGKAAFTPGMGLKLLIDGRPSLDLLAMNHTVGQGRDLNFFSNTFTNDLRTAHNELRPPQKLMKFFFRRVAPEPRWLTIDHLAAVTRDGVAVANPRPPRRLVFRPNNDVRFVFRGHEAEDFRDTLHRIEPGSILYDVEVPGEHRDEPPEVIGRLRLVERFASTGASDRLFFRHQTDPTNRRIRS